MAPPPNQRSGFSRRAQYSNFIAYVAGAAGALLGAALLAIAFANPAAFSALHKYSIDAPVQHFFCMTSSTD